MNKKVAIIGSGSWGVGLSVVLSDNGYEPYLWSFNEDEAKAINENRECIFLPGVKLNENIKCLTDFEEVIKDSSFILLVTPSKFFRETLKKCKQYINEDQPIIVCSKGLEDGTLMTLSEVVEDECPNNKVGILCGPTHAEEVSRNVPTTIVLCSKHEEVLKLQDVFMSNIFRVYTSTDVKGVEVGSAFKNIIAFACGVSAGLGYGDNTFAAIITRGLAEISRIGLEMGGEMKTFYGLSGLGDLIVTCLSQHSRNRKCGYLMGQGLSLEEAQKEVGMVVESINTTYVAKKIIAKYDVETPIINEVYSILFENKNPKDAVNDLMTRNKKME